MIAIVSAMDMKGVLQFEYADEGILTGSLQDVTDLLPDWVLESASPNSGAELLS